MKQRITICDHCNLNVNEDGPRAGQVEPTQVDVLVNAEKLAAYGADLCANCVEKLLTLIKVFVSETERRPTEGRK